MGVSNQFQPRSPSAEVKNLQSKYASPKLNQLATVMEIDNYFKAWKIEVALLAKTWIPDSKSQKKVLKAIKKLKLSENYCWKYIN